MKKVLVTIGRQYGSGGHEIGERMAGILGIPFYTRIWAEDSEGNVVRSATVNMEDIEEVLPDDVERKWDDELKQYYVEYQDGDNTRKMWIEDVESLKAKVSLVKEEGLAGVASWQYGMETEDVWPMLKEELGN